MQRGFLLSDSTAADTVLEQAKSAARRKNPVLINALIGETGFRKGSISM